MHDSFEDEMKKAGVIPLQSSTKIRPKNKIPAEPKIPFRIEESRQVLEESLSIDPYASMHEIESDVELRKPGLTHQRFKKLKQGAIHRQDELYLRGFSVAEAKKRIHNFISQSVNAHKSCVKIIHGRGLNSPDGISKLKLATQQILRLNKFVMGYCEAKGNDGGAGAKYVLLRRRKGKN